jgi:hypothetical protein
MLALLPLNLRLFCSSNSHIEDGIFNMSLVSSEEEGKLQLGCLGAHEVAHFLLHR